MTKFNPDLPAHEQLNNEMFKDQVRIALAHTLKRIEGMADKLPDIATDDKYGDEIATIHALEEEWIIDPVQRMEMSVLSLVQEEEETDQLDIFDLMNLNQPDLPELDINPIEDQDQ